ncbi:unnamed protein product [Acanthosepion pharaonis]|uniref:Uncharacterized protein n=1 Tax=Acanthosepion pharaonis TaxID=158019 RepID=A0A812DZY8_ACAPH|nr:unnamed protein product [Sepia pharaonis]
MILFSSPLFPNHSILTLHFSFQTKPHSSCFHPSHSKTMSFFSHFPPLFPNRSFLVPFFFQTALFLFPSFSKSVFSFPSLSKPFFSSILPTTITLFPNHSLCVPHSFSLSTTHWPLSPDYFVLVPTSLSLFIFLLSVLPIILSCMFFSLPEYLNFIHLSFPSSSSSSFYPVAFFCHSFSFNSVVHHKALKIKNIRISLIKSKLTMPTASLHRSPSSHFASIHPSILPRFP